MKAPDRLAIAIGPALAVSYIAARHAAAGARKSPGNVSQITPVILVGAAAPLSRESMPKQFVPLLGKQSTFQQTSLPRCRPRPVRRPAIATNDAYRFMAESRPGDRREIDILVEPSRRDSEAVMAAAAVYPESGRQGGAGARLGPSGDWRRRNFSRLRRLIAVRQGGIVTLRHPADRAQNRLRLHRRQREYRHGAKVAAFVRKARCHRRPCATSTEGCLWNERQLPVPAGRCCRRWPASSPPWLPPREEAVAKAKKVSATVFLRRRCLAKAPAKSIDYAVMERTDKCWVVPAKFRWSDPGTWDALLDIGEADWLGQRHRGPVELDHVRNSYVRSDGPLTAVIGVEEVVVVAMNDAVWSAIATTSHG